MEKIRILIVDDVSEVRKNLSNLLALEDDVSVIGEARTGKEAIWVAGELLPDVILMDINMPDMDGITATEAIRVKHPFIQVVIVSIQSDQNYMRRAMLAGACDYITKPPMNEELISAIRRAGSRAFSEKAKIRQFRAAIPVLRGEKFDLPSENEKRYGAMEFKQLELSTFDCISRLQLYQSHQIQGRLADIIESLLTGIAHDLKSPISIGMSILEILIKENVEHRTQLNQTWRQLKFIKWLADNFLGVCFSEKPGRGRFVLTSVVDEILDLLSERIPGNIKIEIQSQPNLELFSDERALKIALINLLLNAIESMAGESGQILLTAWQQAEQIHIAISDTGESILPEVETRLFELGFSTRSGHLGNGLYVSRRLLYQNHGSLEYRSSSFPYVKSFEIVLDNANDEAEYNEQKHQELKIGLENLHQHLADLRKKPVAPEDQALLDEEYRRQTSVFTRRLTEELIAAENSIGQFISTLWDQKSDYAISLKKVENNCTYCRLLTRNMLEIGGDSSLAPSSISLIEVIEEVLSLLDRKMPKSLYQVEFEVDPRVENLEADPLQLMQVFMNLIRNALDAMPQGGTLGIYVSQLDNMVFAKIRDTGIGISDKNKSKLFTMGFSTKSNGYGIGLYSVHNIVEKHHGKIEFTSVPGKGTVFTVLLPKHQIA